MDNLLHIIRDEIGSRTDFCLPTAGMLTIKSMGRLRESVVRCSHVTKSMLILQGSFAKCANGSDVKNMLKYFYICCLKSLFKCLIVCEVCRFCFFVYIAVIYDAFPCFQ